MSSSTQSHFDSEKVKSLSPEEVARLKTYITNEAKVGFKAVLMQTAQRAITEVIPSTFMAAFEINTVKIVCECLEEIANELRSTDDIKG